MNALLYIEIERRLRDEFPIHLEAGEVQTLENEMDGILEQIKRSESFEDAQSQLDELALFQSVLATLCFKWAVNLTPRMRELVRAFDRGDDGQVRRHYYEALKA